MVQEPNLLVLRVNLQSMQTLYETKFLLDTIFFSCSVFIEYKAMNLLVAIPSSERSKEIESSYPVSEKVAENNY